MGLLGYLCSPVCAAIQNQEKFKIITRAGPISGNKHVAQTRSFQWKFAEQQVIVGNILSQVIFLLNY